MRLRERNRWKISEGEAEESKKRVAEFSLEYSGMGG